MDFTETPLAGAYVIDLETFGDERGFFGRAWCEAELEEHGLDPRIAQMNLSGNARAGTFRGFHYQEPPHAEVKIMRCVKGATYNVIVDVRPDSPTRYQSFGVELSSDNHRALYVPEGFANGILALTDGAESLYTTSQAYTPGAEKGLRVDDPALGVELPMEIVVQSDKDRAWPLLD